MENSIQNEVDILPTEEIALTLLLLRRTIANSLKIVSRVLTKVANNLEGGKVEDDISEGLSLPEEKEHLSSILTEEKATRSRADTLLSTDSGLEDDCDFSSEVDLETGLEVISLEEVSYHCGV